MNSEKSTWSKCLEGLKVAGGILVFLCVLWLGYASFFPWSAEMINRLPTKDIHIDPNYEMDLGHILAYLSLIILGIIAWRTYSSQRSNAILQRAEWFTEQFDVQIENLRSIIDGINSGNTGANPIESTMVELNTLSELNTEWEHFKKQHGNSGLEKIVDQKRSLAKELLNELWESTKIFEIRRSFQSSLEKHGDLEDKFLQLLELQESISPNSPQNKVLEDEIWDMLDDSYSQKNEMNERISEILEQRAKPLGLSSARIEEFLKSNNFEAN